MRDISVAHGEDRVPLSIHKPPNFYSSKTAGTKAMASRVYTALHGAEPQPRWLTADWLGLGHMGSATTGG